MKVLIAPDKFKDAFPADKVTQAIKEGIEIFDSGIEVLLMPMADGGEGTAKILTGYFHGDYRKVEVRDPLMRSVKASFGISADKKTAFMEMASASGLELLKPGERNCYYTSTFGTGELIKAAIREGVEHIILGIGGSATCDGGMGMAAALGYRFKNEQGESLKPIGRNLVAINKIEKSGVDPDLAKVDIRVACDVDNLLTGPQGAAAVFAPQKGASGVQVKTLEKGLNNLAGQIKSLFDLDVANIPGSGAAGGLGAGAKAFLGASLRPGVDLVMEKMQMRTHIANADLVITGEGKLDSQSRQGKVVWGISRESKRVNTPVAALCGQLETSPQVIRSMGLIYAASIIQKPVSLKAALASTHENLVSASFNLVSLFQAGGLLKE